VRAGGTGRQFHAHCHFHQIEKQTQTPTITNKKIPKTIGLGDPYKRLKILNLNQVFITTFTFSSFEKRTAFLTIVRTLVHHSTCSFFNSVRLYSGWHISSSRCISSGHFGIVSWSYFSFTTASPQLVKANALNAKKNATLNILTCFFTMIMFELIGFESTQSAEWKLTVQFHWF
jgi:hypothetical protein